MPCSGFRDWLPLFPWHFPFSVHFLSPSFPTHANLQKYIPCQLFKMLSAYQNSKCTYLQCHIFIASSTHAQSFRTYCAVPLLHYCSPSIIHEPVSPFQCLMLRVPKSAISWLAISEAFADQPYLFLLEQMQYFLKAVVQLRNFLFSEVMGICSFWTTKTMIVAEKILFTDFYLKLFSEVTLETKGRVQRKQVLSYILLSITALVLTADTVLFFIFILHGLSSAATLGSGLTVSYLRCQPWNNLCVTRFHLTLLQTVLYNSPFLFWEGFYRQFKSQNKNPTFPTIG